MPAMSRRAALSGVAAAAVISTPAAALALTSAPDPVFAAIERAKAANAALIPIWERQEEIENEWFAIHADYPDGIEVAPRVVVTNRDQLVSHFAATHPDNVVRMQRSICEKMNAAGYDYGKGPADPTPAEISAWEDQVTAASRRLGEAHLARDAARERIGLTAIEEEESAAMQIATAAEDEAFATIPTTIKGAAALLAFAQDGVRGCSLGDGQLPAALDTVIAFLESAA